MRASDPTTRVEVYAQFGKAAYEAQCFEVELKGLLLLIHRLKIPGASEETLTKVNLSLSKRNLGFLIQELRKQAEIPHEFEVRFREYRQKRNYLMHNFFFENAYKFLSIEGCRAMISELQELERNLATADSLAQAMSASLRDAMGFSEEQMREYVLKNIRNRSGIALEELT